jgi:hypothetical protein
MTAELKPNIFEGSTKFTCAEAAALIKNGLAIRAWYRPDGVMNHRDPDSDPAFVWSQE